MVKHQTQSTDNVKWRTFPPHLREFLTVSASYLDVCMDSLDRNDDVWRDNANVVNQNNQEVGYATNHV